MSYSLSERLKRAWNVFRDSNRNPQFNVYELSSSSKPDRPRLPDGLDRSIITAIYERLAVDVAAIDVHHAKIDENGKFKHDVKSGLNHILNVEANIDQTARQFMRDAVLTMLSEGTVALIPTDWEDNPDSADGVDILTMRVGTVVEWLNDKVRVDVYNEKKGDHEQILVKKANVGIVENPFYAVMNEQSSVAKRLTRKLQLIDVIDENKGSNKLNMILQLPYIVKDGAKKEHVEKRIKEIETQLKTSEYGIAYTDSTEKIQTLSSPIENNLFEQVEYYTAMLYSQLGMSEEILSGKAEEQEYVNYFNRTVDPILSSIVEELDRKFISKTAHAQGQTLIFYRDPFKLAPAEKLANIMDLYLRNEVLSPNEARSIIGFKPSTDARSDELRNRNISPSEYNLQDPNMAPGMEQPETEHIEETYEDTTNEEQRR